MTEIVEGVDFITLKGKHNTAKVFNTKVEAGAQSQIIELCNHEAFKDAKIRIMSDVHGGAGCVIGFTAALSEKVIPNLVGVDIGCGVTTFKVNSTNTDLKGLDDFIRENIPYGFKKNSEIQSNNTKLIERVEEMCKKFERTTALQELKALGSLGSGNHYLELNVTDKGEQYITVHSGSRHLGLITAKYHQRKAVNFCRSIHEKLPKDLCYLIGADKDEYLKDMQVCQDFAVENRMLMLKKIVEEFFKQEFMAEDMTTSTHNYIDFKDNIIRKGAISAYDGELIVIPMNMRDGLIFGYGKGCEEANFSAPHGAGRLMGRRVAKETLSVDTFRKQMSDVFSTCVGKGTLDEAPNAYKPTEEILKFIEPMVDVIEIAKPIYNFKA